MRSLLSRDTAESLISLAVVGIYVLLAALVTV